MGRRNWCSIVSDPPTGDLIFDIRVEEVQGRGKTVGYVTVLTGIIVLLSFSKLCCTSAGTSVGSKGLMTRSQPLHQVLFVEFTSSCADCHCAFFASLLYSGIAFYLCILVLPYTDPHLIYENFAIVFAVFYIYSTSSYLVYY